MSKPTPKLNRCVGNSLPTLCNVDQFRGSGLKTREETPATPPPENLRTSNNGQITESIEGIHHKMCVLQDRLSILEKTFALVLLPPIQTTNGRDVKDSESSGLLGSLNNVETSLTSTIQHVDDMINACLL